MTRELFREDGYLRECAAVVSEVRGHAVVTDQTVFYPTGGGQPGDSGCLLRADGTSVKVTTACKDAQDGALLHVCEGAAAEDLPAAGAAVKLQLDWPRRHRMMRMHSCMHMLCALIAAPVTGGQISDGRGRLDFDLQEPVDKEELTQKLNQLIAENHPMEIKWITADELRAQPQLVRTMSVKPPLDGGRVRLVHFHGVDLQPCGGTHVAASGEIGAVRVAKVEKKGKRNRRVAVVFDE
ncbi:MAG: alanyl-tRNA editing protein [Gammaproteobacteria bacterium]|nr:alanyl-tRNA editing protein [Gammaproteobacteria bacterium]